MGKKWPFVMQVGSSSRAVWVSRETEGGCANEYKEGGGAVPKFRGG